MANSEQPATRIRRLTIVRDDHIGDPIGAIFLEPDDGPAGIVRRIADYLGPKTRILATEMMHDRVRVEVQSSPFFEESSRLAAAATELWRKGAPRNALSMYQEALALDSLNGHALHQLGLLLAELKQTREALLALRRAREVLGDSLELLQSLARVCVLMERIPSAIGYLERALEMEPHNPSIRRDLVALGRKPPPPPSLPSRGTRAARRSNQ